MKNLLFFLFLTLHASNSFGAGRFYQNILYVGDSHSYGPFGQEMGQFLEGKSNRAVLYASCGASSSTWLGNKGNEKTVCGFWSKDGKEETRSTKFKTPRFKTLVEEIRPDLTVIQLGTNMAVSNPKAAMKSIEEMLMLVKNSGSKCIWIGPPDSNSKVVSDANVKEINNILFSLTKKYNCSYIDSLRLTNYPSHVKEGIHYPNKDSKEWAKKVIRLIY